ncbi:unnamed protein product [Miscanthus lutarioriparius]|uniref:DUF1645 family protein n=1 Tax=Miscanthus lutarioriparius TaxID=422564 RepID=A0A811NYW6_9POAL|nr:unnamed protein product [Miscanthus lutarioriparius]
MEDDRPVVRRRQEPTVVRTEDDDVASCDEDSDSDGEFEFPFVSRESAEVGAGAAAADELFAGGRIRAFYPVFGRVLDEAAPAPAAPAPRASLGRLFQLEQARTSSVASMSSSSSSTSASSSTTDTGAGAGAGLDGASPDSYCLWTPGSSASAASSPSRPPRKSGSTGSIPRWRRIGELVVGRSHSDGREKFLFLSAPPSPARDREHSSSASEAKAKQPPKGSKAAAAATAAATELDTIAAGRRVSYGSAKASTGGGRRTFLPYRQDLVGLFANVRGLSRSHHPF